MSNYCEKHDINYTISVCPICPAMNNITDFTSIRASAVPSVPKTLSASQRLAALNEAQQLEDASEFSGAMTVTTAMEMLKRTAKLLRELAGDCDRNTDSVPETLITPSQGAWHCQHCQQLNSSWAGECGRCGHLKDVGSSDLAGDAKGER